ncbi:hypothetical protein SCALM49S_04910 [Streptomyces californicus]
MPTTRARPGGAPVGGAHAGDGPGVRRGGFGRVAGGREPGAYGFDERVPYAFHGVHRVGLGSRDGEGGDGLVPGDLARALAEDERVPRRDPLHAGVGRAVAERFGGLGAGEQGGEVPDVELGLDEVGERQGRGGEGGAAGPRGVEDRAGRRPGRSRR